MLECLESGQIETAVSREYLASKAFPRDTRETFCSASLSSLIHTFMLLVFVQNAFLCFSSKTASEAVSREAHDLELPA